MQRFTRKLPIVARRAEPGQSVVLLALMIVVLVAMVGLSVDVGNAYAQQRRVQQAANAAALAGMNVVQNGGTNGDVQTEIRRTLGANGIDYNSSRYTYTASYRIDGDSTPHLISGYDQNAKPSNVQRVQVTLHEDVDTFFARVVGRQQLPANADGYACIGGWNLGVYPIGIPQFLNPIDPDKQNKYLGWNSSSHSGSQEVAPFLANGQPTPGWTDWHTYADSPYHTAEYVKIQFGNNKAGLAGVHQAYLTWGNSNSSNSELEAALTYPGNLNKVGFHEATPPDGSSTGGTPGELEQNDWIGIDTGEHTAITDKLSDHVARGDVMLFPMYSKAGGNGNSRALQMVKMGKFRLVDAKMTPASDAYMVLEFLGESNGSVVSCAQGTTSGGAGGTGPTTTPNVSVTGYVRYDRLYADQDSNNGSRTSDVVVIQSVSENMNGDWSGGSTGVARKAGVETELKTFVDGVMQDDHKTRLGAVSYGRSGGLTTSYNWTTDVATAQGNMTAMKGEVQAGNQRPLASGLSQAASLWNSSTRSGAHKAAVVIVDGVPNATTSGTTQRYSGSIDTWISPRIQLQNGWALWQAQDKADNFMHPNDWAVYVVALMPFDTTGLRDISSGTGFYYEVSSQSGLRSVLASIQASIAQGPSTPTNSNVARCNPHSQLSVMGGVEVTLFNADGTQAKSPVITASDGSFSIANVPAGSYTITVDSATGNGVAPLFNNHAYGRVFDYDDRGQQGGPAAGAIPVSVGSSNVSVSMLLRETGNESGCKPY